MMSDIEMMNKNKEDEGMIAGLQKEFVRELDNYKADVFKKNNIYIVRDFSRV